MALLLPVVLALTAVGCDRTPGPSDTEHPIVDRVEEMSPPVAPGSGEPFLSATASGDLLLSWLEPDSSGEGSERWSLSVTRWDGESWASPSRPVRRDDLFVNWADFPSVRELPDGRWMAHWLQSGPSGGYDYGVRVAVSGDRGASWSRPGIPHLDGTPTEHGFVSYFVPGPGADVAARPGNDSASEAASLGYLLWLDGRVYASEPDAPRMTLRARPLAHFLEGLGDEATPFPNGADVRPDTSLLVDPRVCDCCQTAATGTRDGGVVVFRDRTSDEVRDIYARRWTRAGGWSEGTPVRNDGWVIDACPVNGPAVAAVADTVVVAWFSAADDDPAVRAAYSFDGGATFEPAVRLDLGDPAGRVDVVALPGGDAIVSWIERGGEEASIVLRRLSPTGSLSPAQPIGASSAARSSGFPRMARLGDTLFLAWTDAARSPRELRLVRTEIADR